MANLWILDRIRIFGENDFFIEEDRKYTYRDLKDRINRQSLKIKEYGIKSGDCVALVGDCFFEYVPLFWALIINQNIIIPIDQTAVENLNYMLKVGEADYLITVSENAEISVSKIACQRTSHLLIKLQQKAEAGIIIFTSGSTGEAKAAVLKVSSLIKRYQDKIRKSYIGLVFLKIDHIGGINTLFSMMLNGGTIVTIKKRTADEVCQKIEQNNIQLLPTTPTFLNMMLISDIHTKYDLSSLEMISYGTEPMPEETLKELSRYFSNVHFKQTYGLTELGIFSTKSKDSKSTWMKVGGGDTQIKVVNQTLWIKTDTAMLGYMNAADPFDADGWYNTGDKVEMDGEYIRVIGRESEIINVAGEKVYPAEVENILLEVENVRDVLVYGMSNAVTGQIVAALIQVMDPEEAVAMKRKIRAYCKSKLPEFKIPKIIKITEQGIVGKRLKKNRNINAILSEDN